MASFGRGGIRDIVDITFFDLTTLKPVLFLESLKMSSLTVGAETVAARGGRGNPRRIIWDGTKDVDIKGEDCLISPAELALLLGSTLATGAVYSPVTEVITVTGTSATLTATPYTSDLVTYPMTVVLNTNNDRATVGTELAIGAVPAAGEYKNTNGVLTFGTTYADQQLIVTYYTATSATNKRITITSDQFPQTFKLTGYTLWRDEATGSDYPCKITIPKAKLLTPFTITQANSGDPSVFAINFMVLKDGRSTTMVIYDVEVDAPIN